MGRKSTLVVFAVAIACVWLLMQDQPVVHPGSRPSPSNVVGQGVATQTRHPRTSAVGTPQANRTSRKPAEGDEGSGGAEDPDRAAARRLFASLATDQSPTDMHQRVMAAMRESNLHPPHNRRFQAVDADPIVQRYQVERRTTFSEDGSRAITVWSDRTHYSQGDAVVVRAQLQAGEGTAPLELESVEALVLHGESKAVGRVDLLDPDGDGIFEGTFDSGKSRPGIHKALVSPTADLVESVGFMVNEPTASFTGRYRDRLQGGDLVIEAEVAVQSPGPYQIRGTLYETAETSIGSASVNHDLRRGKQWVSLNFHGLLFHRAEVDGPYLLKHVTLIKRTMPPRWGGDVQPGYRTEAYDRAVFSDEVYNPL